MKFALHFATVLLLLFSTSTFAQEFLDSVEIERQPIFPGCEDIADEEQQFMCFQQKLNQHILENYRYPELAKQHGVQGKVYVSFIIEANGEVTNVEVEHSSRSEMLDQEGIRIISLLPKMTPAQSSEGPVRIQYTVPINFKLVGKSLREIIEGWFD